MALGAHNGESALAIDVLGSYPQLKSVLSDWQLMHPDWVWTALQWRQDAQAGAMQLSLQAAPLATAAWKVVVEGLAQDSCAKRP